MAFLAATQSCSSPPVVLGHTQKGGNDFAPSGPSSVLLADARQLGQIVFHALGSAAFNARSPSRS
jgi:hypothetical protein